MNLEGVTVKLEITGLGIIFYSPKHAHHIAEGEDYFSTHFITEEQVQEHIQKGTIVGFGTGSPGAFALHFHDGYPDESELPKFEFKLRLGLNCSGGLVCIKDLYDLMDWHKDCPKNQELPLPDGLYHVTLCSNAPASGILGENQIIHVYLQQLDALPYLAKRGIPTLCT